MTVLDCPFCGAGGGDDHMDWVERPGLRHVYNALYNGTPALSLTRDFFYLQYALDGRKIQPFFVHIYAIWRSRCAIVNGHLLRMSMILSFMSASLLTILGFMAVL